MSEKSQRIAARVQDEHARLEEQIATIKGELNQPVIPDRFSEWRLEFIWMIRDFQNELKKHFDLEEDGGFMEDVVARAPRFAPRVRTLELEHIGAIKQLDDVTTSLKHLTAFDESEWERISSRIMGLFETLEAHESAERDLILEVYYQDIGVGD